MFYCISDQINAALNINIKNGAFLHSIHNVIYILENQVITKVCNKQ